MIPVKNAKEIEKMRLACRIVAETFAEVEKYIAVGITTKELDTIIAEFIKSKKAKPSFKNYRGYPANSCISINSEVIHGIPKNYALKDGDMVSVDLGAYKDGFHGDAARTYLIGESSETAKHISQVAKECFYEGIKEAIVGKKIGDISSAIGRHAVKNGYSLVQDYTGHGIGRKLHENPSIPNYGTKGEGAMIKAGYTLAIEPMICEGHHDITVDSDKWTVRTKDGKLSAHYENTILIVSSGEPEILTLL